MITFSHPKIEVVMCDNGYVVEWQDETRRQYAITNLPDTPTRGVVICVSKAEVINFVETFFKRK